MNYTKIKVNLDIIDINMLLNEVLESFSLIFKINNIDLIKNIPIDKILVETDSPFCLIRKSYAGAEYGKVLKVKENEPVYILNLIEIISNIKQMPIQQLIHQFKLNTIKCFPQLKKFQ